MGTKNTLIETLEYKSEEDFRQKIHSAFLTINQKILETDAFKSYWDIVYKGNKILERNPKKEPDIQPLIHSWLSDQMLMAGIKVIPESTTGAGDLDFLFTAYVNEKGICSFCAEFKLAHSQDLFHGLYEQLPKYMRAVNAKYGAYCILDYRGDWFDKSTTKDKSGLKKGVSLQSTLMMVPEEHEKPKHANIRSFVFKLGKPKTASKKTKTS